MGELLTYGEWELLTVFARLVYNVRLWLSFLRAALTLRCFYLCPSVTCSFLGPAEVAAWGLLGTLWSALELVTEAVADSGEVRVAYLLGSSQPSQAKLSSYKAIYLALFCALFLTSILFIGGEDVPTWLTSDPTLQRICADLMPMFGIGNVALTVGTMSWTLVGCQARYALSTAVGLAGSWFITIPLAAILTLGLKMDLQGQTAAVVIGYMVSGTINTFILFQTDWPKMSRRVIADFDDSASSSSSSSSAGNADDDDGGLSFDDEFRKKGLAQGRPENRGKPDILKLPDARAAAMEKEEEHKTKSGSSTGGTFLFNPLSYFSSNAADVDPNQQQLSSPPLELCPTSDGFADQLDSFRQSFVKAVGSTPPGTPDRIIEDAKAIATSASGVSAVSKGGPDDELFNV